MYRYDEYDEAIVRQRAAQFRGQVERRIDGSLTEEEFTPLRLMNGLYLQLHAYMLRVAVPYGTLNSRQLRQLAHIADKYDRGYGHFTTRQNIQFNWPKLRDIPDILDSLADVEMHAIQTSGNCIRNVTADPYAGVAAESAHLLGSLFGTRLVEVDQTDVAAVGSESKSDRASDSPGGAGDEGDASSCRQLNLRAPVKTGEML